ncbi:MAG: hypothetical protein ACLGIJ_05210 [Candidatus Limnocylindria bacterium]
MIVVIGAIVAGGVGPVTVPAGLAARIALAAASADGRVEVVARIGDDPAGDAVLLALAAGRVGHVATLRDAAHATPAREAAEEPIDPDGDGADGDGPGGDGPGGDGSGEEPADASASSRPTLDAADVGLAMRYLDDYRVIVVVYPSDPGIVREVVAAADWASAHLVVVTVPGQPAPGDLPAGSLVVAAADDADGVGDVIGRYAAAVDAGTAPKAAFEATFSASA